jgi:hypothetical protein
VDDLEAALRARWDRETLRVYADVLQAAGNPRGELIALDLELAEKGYTHELAMRRRTCLHEWLGGPRILDRPWHEASFSDGFATDFYVAYDGRHYGAEYLEALFASPAGPYVRGLTLGGGRPDDVREMLEVLIRAQRPWLERLSIDIVEYGAEIPRALPSYVIDVTPHLHTLELTGCPAFAKFPHPAVRRLAIASGGLALAQTVPHLDTIDLLLGESDREDNETGVRTHIIEMLHTLPALRHLDLARNEPTYPRRRPLPIDTFRLVRWLPGAIRTVRLPAFREPDQVTALGEAIELRRELHVAVARAYRQLAHVWQDVSHERLHLPTPFWWPSREMTSPREALTITLPTEEHGDDVSLVSLIDLLDAQFATLPPAARAAWRDFWEFVDDLRGRSARGVITRSFPAATLLTAVEPLDDIAPSNAQVGPWAQLAETLRSADLPADAGVSIRRHWAW